MKSSKRRLCRGSGWMSRGHYEVLGLKPDATVTDKEIRRAYKKLSLRHHPDKNLAENSAKAEGNFRELTEAYEVLSDPGKRKAYDAEILSERKVASGPEFHRARSVAEDVSGEDEDFYRKELERQIVSNMSKMNFMTNVMARRR